jgi:diguanylate cyclase (GGDEF)-like protein
MSALASALLNSRPPVNSELAKVTASPYALIAIPNVNRAATFRQAISDTLSLETVLVRDGDEVLHEMARRGPPALIIVDLSLPRVDGFAVVRRIRRQTPETDTRIIVVAGHESLRAAARELAAPLAIASILPLDADRVAVTEVLEALQAPSETLAATATSDKPHPYPETGPGIDDLVERATIEARRRCRMPIGIGYIRVGDHEDLTFHVASQESRPAAVLSEISDFRFLRQVADGTDPLVIPSVPNHPVFAQFLARGTNPVRGFVAVPIVTSRENVRAALCVLDLKPIALSASDIDMLAAYGREVADEIDRRLTSPREDQAGDTKPRELDEEVKALQHLAATDPLTGVANRRGGEKHISNEISRAKREKKPLSCILLDLDRFKQVNDTFGHQAGDQLLRDVANLLRRTVRAYDIVVRWGGEEFLLVLPGVDLDVARLLAERVRAAIEAMDTHGIGPVTISAGVAKFENDYDFGATLKTADRRLYQAKAGGRNRVV